MALIRSNLLSSISGSLNGTTFARNAAGAYMRNRTKPVNPNTPNQILARSGLTAAATSWRELTNLQQVAWKTYAQNTPRLNRIGETIHLSGIGEYMRLNAFLQFLSKALVPNAPSAYGSPTPVTDIAVTISAATNDLAIDTIVGSSIEPAATYGVWISNAVSPGVSYYKGPWTHVGTVQGDDITTTPFGAPFSIVVGNLYFVRLRYTDEFTRLSNEFIFGPFAAGV